MSSRLIPLFAAQCWQIAALVIVVAIITRFLGKRRAHFAYVLWLLVLLKCLTPPVISNSAGIFCGVQNAVDRSLSSHVTPESACAASDPLPTPAWTDHLLNKAGSGTLHVSGSPDSASNVVLTAQSLELMSDHHQAAMPASAAIAELRATNTTLAPLWQSWAVRLLIILLVVSCAVFLIALTRVIVCVRCALADSIDAPEDLQRVLSRLSRRLRLRQPPRLIITQQPVGPAVLGILRPALLLPHCVIDAATPEQLEPILVHELLHIRRGDLCIGFLQTLTLSLWWFHPAVWFSSRLLSRETERCCDEETIAELGCSPKAYARALLRVLETKHILKPVPVVPGIRRVDLTSQRIGRIMKLRKKCQNRTPFWCWLTLLAAAIIVLPGAALVANDEKVVKQLPVSTQSVSQITATASKAAPDDRQPAQVTVIRAVIDQHGEPPRVQLTTGNTRLLADEIEIRTPQRSVAELHGQAHGDDETTSRVPKLLSTVHPAGLSKLRGFEVRSMQLGDTLGETDAEIQRLRSLSERPTDVAADVFGFESTAPFGLRRRIAELRGLQLKLAKAALEAPEVTARDAEHAAGFLRVYPVSDLLMTQGDRSKPDGREHTNAEFESLISLIKDTIAPDTWVSETGVIQSNPDTGSLIIRQTPANHTAIQSLLQEVRKLQQSAIKRGDLEITTRSYPIADLVVPNTDAISSGVAEDEGRLEAIIGLIRTSLPPGDWKNDDVDWNDEELSLVIRQSGANHRVIEQVLAAARSFDDQQLVFDIGLVEIRNDDQVFSDRVRKTAPSLLEASVCGILREEERAGLMEGVRSNKSATILAMPRAVNFTGQDATIQLASDQGDLKLAFSGHLAPKGNLIRLRYGITFDGSQPLLSSQRLVKSGMTLVTRVEVPADSVRSVLLMLSPARLIESDVVSESDTQ